MLPSRLFRNTGLPPALRSLITPRASLPPNITVQLRLRLGVLQGFVNSANAYSSSGPSTAPGSSAPAPASSSSGSTTPTPTPPLSRSASTASQLASPSERSLASTPAINASSQPLPEKLEPRLSMTFTCTVKGCDRRSTHEFSKRAYESGIVLVQCPGCTNRWVSGYFE
jgi:protein import protein ZIM17